MSDLPAKKVAELACDLLGELARQCIRTGRDGADAMPEDVAQIGKNIIHCITLLQHYAETGSHVLVSAATTQGEAP